MVKIRLINTSKGKVIADNVQLAGTFKSRLIGLMGRPYIRQGEALILYPCKSVHTCFMRFPVDVIFASSDAVVLHTIQNLKPYRFSPVIPHSYLVIELPAGSLSSTGTVTGDSLQLIEKEAMPCILKK